MSESTRVQVQFQSWVNGEWQKVGRRTWLERDMVPPVGDQIIITRTMDVPKRTTEDFQYVVKERIWSLMNASSYGVIIVVEEATQ
ncbi:hypothetical protein SEA_FRIBS8_58 [Gordonia phage Fribs8]|nr:hypothetical protein SEA_NIBBLES_57 [Gordonia phage Nibbles]WNN95786.1 hypothetical protein SEA_FRIBS8_58 [Gordonia phage Fribs8]